VQRDARGAGWLLQVASLALKACLYRKLDLRDTSSAIRNQVGELRLACTQLADPESVELEGLVHDLQPNTPAVLLRMH
jgi:hypothetical protein